MADHSIRRSHPLSAAMSGSNSSSGSGGSSVGNDFVRHHVQFHATDLKPRMTSVPEGLTISKPRWLSQQLHEPFFSILHQPWYTLVGFFVFSALSLFIGWLLRLIAYCITPIGVVVLFTVAAIIGLRRLCQFLVFAGTSGFVLRSIMRDFAKPVVRHVKRSLSAAKHLDDSLEYRTIADATQLSVLLTAVDEELPVLRTLKRGLEATRDNDEDFLQAGHRVLRGLDRVLRSYQTLNDTLRSFAATAPPAGDLFVAMLDSLLMDTASQPAAHLQAFREARKDFATIAKWIVEPPLDSELALREAQEQEASAAQRRRRDGGGEEDTAGNPATRCCYAAARALRQAAGFIASSVRSLYYMYYAPPPLLNLDYYRQDLVSKGAQLAWVKGASGLRIDTLFYPAPSADRDAPTLVVCNPNAGVYELLALHYGSVYHPLGMHVFVWNYRGYGRSEGSPTIQGLMADAPCIITHVSNTLGASATVVHGESIGGAVATVAAQHGSVKMWVADRNFADLPGVAKRTFAWWAGIGLWVLTGWTAYTVDKFLTAPCPKVIAADAHDEVVVWLSSMAVGVAKSVALTSTPSRGAAASVPDEQRDLQWLRAHALDSALVERFVRAMRRIALRVQPWLPCAEFADEEETQQQQVNYIARVLYDPTIPAAMPPLYRRDYEGDNHAVGVLARQAAAVAHVRSMFPVEPKPGVAEDDVAHPLFDLRRMHLAGFFVAVCGIYSGTLRLGEALGDGVEGMEAFVATTLLYALPQHASCVPEDSHHKHSDHQAAPIGYQHQGQSWCRTNLAQCLATVTALQEHSPALQSDQDVVDAIDVLAQITSLHTRFHTASTDPSAATGGSPPAGTGAGAGAGAGSASSPTKSLLISHRALVTAQQGAFVPLSCGHNGEWSRDQKAALHTYLRVTGAIPALTNSATLPPTPATTTTATTATSP